MMLNLLFIFLFATICLACSVQDPSSALSSGLYNPIPSPIFCITVESPYVATVILPGTAGKIVENHLRGSGIIVLNVHELCIPLKLCFGVEGSDEGPLHLGCRQPESPSTTKITFPYRQGSLYSLLVYKDSEYKELLFNTSIDVKETMKFEPRSSWSYEITGSKFPVDLEVGRATYGIPKPQNIFVFDNEGWKINVGSFCSISVEVTFIMAHGEHDYLSPSTFPFRCFQESVGHLYNWKNPDGSAKNIYESIVRPKHRVMTIGNDVWIGLGATIINGIIIGDGAVIGAHSTVRSDVPPYAIVAGNPAQIIKYRFDNDTINKLLDIKWWDLEDEELFQIMPWTHSVVALVEYVGLRRGGYDIAAAFARATTTTNTTTATAADTTTTA